MTNDAAFYHQMYRIRRFEETVLDRFSSGVFYGTTHTYIGQEANAVGVLKHLQQGDVVISNHRCHGHFIAYGGDTRSLFAELMGKQTGICGGRGGSQHIHWNNFYSNGILGSTIPIAVGAALAERFKESQNITIAFMGDGTLGQGVVYEALNLASLWKAPVLFVLENNRIAQTTPIDAALAGSITARFHAFDIPTQELDSSDVREISVLAEGNIDEVRKFISPHALIIHTHRFAPHSKGDDSRPHEEIKSMRATRDPLTIQGKRLNVEERQEIEKQVDVEISYAFERAQQDPYPEEAI